MLGIITKSDFSNPKNDKEYTLTIIHLIRHGQASFGQQNYDQLSATGEIQAQVLGEYLAEIINETPFVVSGSMQRHQQTAHLALQQFIVEPKINIDDCWNEFDHQQVFAQYNARFANPKLIKQDIAAAENPTEFMTELFNAAMMRWIDAKHDHQYTESWIGFNQRVDQALQNLALLLDKHKPKHAAVFSSGGVISLILAKLLELNFAQTADLIWTISNASTTTLHFVDQQFHVLAMNQYQYLQTEEKQLATWV